MNYKTLLLASAIMAFAGFTTGCSNACDDARDKAEECGATVKEGDEDAACEADAECAAECINDSSCEEIKSTDLTGPFFQCVAACAE